MVARSGVRTGQDVRPCRGDSLLSSRRSGRFAWLAVAIPLSAVIASCGLPAPSIAQSASPSASGELHGSPGASGPDGLLTGTVVRATRPIELTPDWTIRAGQLAYVVEGPIEGPDGPSYRLQTWGDLTSGLKPDTTFGLVAAADAEESLVPAPPNCPTGAPTLTAIANLQPFERLICFGSRELTFGPVTASDYRVGARTSPRWLSVDGQPDFFTGLPFYVADQELAIADGAFVEVTGQFDAPSSAACGSVPDVAWCRQRFFVTAATPVDPPEFVLRGDWRTIAEAPISGRTEHRLVWSGREMIVWGGNASDEEHSAFDGQLPSGGAAYDPRADAWRTIPDAPVGGRLAPVVAWTGSAMVAFGGYTLDGSGTAAALDGAIYDPETDRWRPIAAAPLTGGDTVGGWVAGRLVIVTNDAAAQYDPATDRWTVLPPPPIRPGWRYGIAIAGRLVVLAFGDGATGVAEGAVFVPSTRTWTTIDVPIDPIEAGTEIVAVGDRVAAVVLGRVLDPISGTWSTERGCDVYGGVWTGSLLLSDRAAWDPASGSCRDVPPSPPRAPPFDDTNGREFPSAVWTGDEYVTWSGGTGGDIVWVPNDGAAFRPD